MCCTCCRGYAFIEFDSKAAVDDAARAMNLFDLGGQYLRVGRVRTVLFCAILLSNNRNNLQADRVVAIFFIALGIRMVQKWQTLLNLISTFSSLRGSIWRRTKIVGKKAQTAVAETLVSQ